MSNTDLTLEALLFDIRQCTYCVQHLPAGPRPIVSFSERSKIIIISQAPGAVVHASGVAWMDKSGERLRDWLGVDEATFYDTDHFAILPMGFCYPGRGKSGDLPPRPECAPLWHEKVWGVLQQNQLTLVIGQYAQAQYLKDRRKKTLTATVQSYKEYAPDFFPLPHPSPRNNIWLRKNPWFTEEVLPILRRRITSIIN